MQLWTANGEDPFEGRGLAELIPGFAVSGGTKTLAPMNAQVRPEFVLTVRIWPDTINDSLRCNACYVAAGLRHSMWGMAANPGVFANTARNISTAQTTASDNSPRIRLKVAKSMTMCFWSLSTWNFHLNNHNLHAGFKRWHTNIMMVWERIYTKQCKQVWKRESRERNSQ